MCTRLPIEKWCAKIVYPIDWLIYGRAYAGTFGKDGGKTWVVNKDLRHREWTNLLLLRLVI